MIILAEGDVNRDRPEVSVVLPAWNAAATLAEAIVSVQAQEGPSWELIVVDDASTDTTGRIAAAAARADGRVRLARLAVRGGAAAARNQGLMMARARRVAFLDADDLWLPGKLAAQVAHMDDTGAGLSFTGYIFRRRDGVERRVHVPDRIDHAGLLEGNVIGCLTVMIDRVRVGGPVVFPALERRQDFALWLRLLRGNDPAAGLDRVLAVHRRTAGSLSSARMAALAATWDVYRRQERIDRVATARLMAGHVLRRIREIA
jgi:teichuronic acid biosynthesis glycosyltransferase TuaG